MMDVLIIGGGVAGLQCALVLGSATDKPVAQNKSIGIVLHQKSSHLLSAELNNVLGLAAGSNGKEVLESGTQQLKALYPKIDCIEKEKVMAVEPSDLGGFQVVTNKNEYHAKICVIAIGYTDLFAIKGLTQYVMPHQMSKPEKNRIQLKNEAYKITEGLYVAGTLAGGRSQFAIAAGSGAQVATDILSLWQGNHVKVHDKLG